VSGAENGAERAERGAERGAGMAEHDGAGAECGAGGPGAGSGLNRPLTARSQLTYIVRILRSAVYSFSLHYFTLHALALSLVPTRPNL